MLLEPSFPPPRRHWILHYGPRIKRPTSWANVVSGRSNTLKRTGQRIVESVRRQLSPPAEHELPRAPGMSVREPRQLIHSVYSRLRDRGIPLLVALTGESWYYRESFVDAFPGLRFDDLTVDYLQEADHTFAGAADRRRLIDAIVGWSGQPGRFRLL